MTASPQRTRVLRYLKTLPEDAPFCVYQLKQATRLPSGTILPMLRWLHEHGYVRRRRETKPHRNGPGTQLRPPRVLYRLTDTGKQLVADTTPEED